MAEKPNNRLIVLSGLAILIAVLGAFIAVFVVFRLLDLFGLLAYAVLATAMFVVFSLYRALRKKQSFWIALSIAMSICIGLIVFEFLPDSPILAWIIILAGALVCFATFPSLGTRKVFKVMFLSILVFLAAFATILNVGAFESMSLMNDSWIDTSHCAMIFHVRNTGLTRWHILQVQVNNVTFSINPFSSGQISEYVERLNDAYLLFYYCDGIFQWIPSNYAASIHWDATNPFDPAFPEDELKYAVNSQIIPSTFMADSTYQVTFCTGSVITHTFEVQAKATLNERLNIQGYSSASNDSGNVYIVFNNTGSYYSYIYTFQINNITFRMNHFLQVPPSTQYPITLLLDLNQKGLVGYGSWRGLRIYPDGNFTSTALERETPVNVTVMTIANNLFTGQLKVVNS